MKRFIVSIGIGLGLMGFWACFAPDCLAGDQRRVQHSTVACTETGLLKKALHGSHSRGKEHDERCISLREGDVVVVEREAPPYAQVRPGGKVDRYWMPLEPVTWKKP